MESAAEKASSADPSQLARSSTLVGLCTFLSRVLGFARESLMVALLGVGPVGGAVTFAMAVPNFFRRIFGEGALTALFLPLYVRTRGQEGEGVARRLVAAVLGGLVAILGALSVLVVTLCVVLPREWLPAEPGKAQQVVLTLDFLAVVFPYAVLVCLFALAMAVLNAHGRFFVPAFAPALQNAVAILGVGLAFWLHFEGVEAGLLVAWFFLLSGAVQLAVQFPELVRCGMLVAPRLERGHPAVRTIAREMAPLILGLGLVQVNLLVDQAVAAAFVGEGGGNQYVNLGNRLLQLPIGILGVSTATVVFPLFTRLFAAGELRTLRFELDRAIRQVSFLAFPAAAGLAALCTPVARVLFEHGRFTPEDTARTAPVIAVYALAVPALCVLPTVARVFYAANDTRTPVKLASGLVFLNVALSLLLVHPLGAAGVALATTIVSWLNLLGLLWLLGRQRLPRSENLRSPLLRMGLAAGLCGGGAWGAERWLGGFGAFAGLLAGIAAGAVAYFALCPFLRIREGEAFLRILESSRTRAG